MYLMDWQGQYGLSSLAGSLFIWAQMLIPAFATPGTVTAGADLANLCRALVMGTGLEHIRFEEWGSTT
jgi:hypothetical protein